MNTGFSGEEDYIYLEEDYLLRVLPHIEGVAGEVIMRDRNRKDRGTHLFDVPGMYGAEALKDWAMQALRAYREG